MELCSKILKIINQHIKSSYDKSFAKHSKHFPNLSQVDFLKSRIRQTPTRLDSIVAPIL